MPQYIQRLPGQYQPLAVAVVVGHGMNDRLAFQYLRPGWPFAIAVPHQFLDTVDFRAIWIDIATADTIGEPETVIAGIGVQHIPARLRAASFGKCLLLCNLTAIPQTRVIG